MVDIGVKNAHLGSKEQFPGGGGGGEHLHSPNILVGMCCGKVKNGGSGASSSVTMGGSGANSSVKMGVSGTDFVGRVCLALRGTVISKLAVGGDERLERKEMLCPPPPPPPPGVICSQIQLNHYHGIPKNYI